MKKSKLLPAGFAAAVGLGLSLSTCSSNLAPETGNGRDVRSLEIRFEPQNSGLKGSLRGVSAVDSRVAWVSGAGGSYSRTLNGGREWQPGIVAGAEELDFRDIEAWSSEAAVLMSAGPGDASRIYTTGDGGLHWTLRLSNPEPDGFFDGMAFSDARAGFLYGDAIDGKPFVMRTGDGGTSWTRIDPELLPPLIEGEIGFAASGTGIVAHGERVWIATGGARARVFHSPDRGQTWRVAETPIVSGDPASGIFSLATSDGQTLVAVGGSYQTPDRAGGNLAITRDGVFWSLLQADPAWGYKSVIAFLPETRGLGLLVSGTSGSNYSADGGHHWLEIESAGYHAVDFGTTLDAGWAAGAEGRVARILVQ